MYLYAEGGVIVGVDGGTRIPIVMIVTTPLPVGLSPLTTRWDNKF